MITKAFVFSLVLLFTISSFAQITDYTSVENYTEIYEEIHFRAELLANLDSIYVYQNDYDDLFLANKTVNMRHNEYGKPLEHIYEIYDSELDSWIVTSKSIFEYYDDQSLKKIDIYNWDSENNDWIIDRNNTYDSNGNLIESFRISDIQYGIFPPIPGKKGIYVYNSNGDLDSKTFYMRDHETNTWKIGCEFQFEYAENNLIFINTKYYDPITSEFSPENSSIDSLFYNNNQIIEYKHFQFDEDQNLFESYHVAFEYFDDGTVTQILKHWYTNINEWKNFRKTSIKYDENNRIVEYQFEDWDDESKDWYLNFIEQYEYENDNLLLTIQKHWNSELQDFQYMNRFGNEFNEYNLAERYFYQQWNYDLQEWIDASQFLYSYSENKDEICKLHQIWDENEEIWLNAQIDSNKYDEYNRLIEYAHFSFFENDAYWRETRREEYYFDNQIINNIKEQSNLTLLYPNPVSDFIFLNNNEYNFIEIYDINGKLCFRNKTSINDFINVSYLKQGSYILKTDTELTFKFIKQ